MTNHKTYFGVPFYITYKTTFAPKRRASAAREEKKTLGRNWQFLRRLGLTRVSITPEHVLPARGERQRRGRVPLREALRETAAAQREAQSSARGAPSAPSCLGRARPPGLFRAVGSIKSGLVVTIRPHFDEGAVRHQDAIWCSRSAPRAQGREDHLKEAQARKRRMRELEAEGKKHRVKTSSRSSRRWRQLAIAWRQAAGRRRTSSRA